MMKVNRAERNAYNMQFIMLSVFHLRSVACRPETVLKSVFVEWGGGGRREEGDVYQW